MEKKEEHLTDIMAGDNVKKKRNTTILLAILIPTLVVAGTWTIIYQITKNEEANKALTFYLPATDGLSNWSYQLSNNTVLAEADEARYDTVFDTYYYWEFKPIGSGEVTIYFIDEYLIDITEENCFST